MRIVGIALLLLILPEATGYGASRTWKFRNGNELKADFIGGVLENRIVLKVPGNRRLYFRLSEFSLADRDFIVSHFTKRNDPKDLRQLAAMMAFENSVRPIDPDAASTNSDGGESSPVPSNPFNPLAHPNAAPQGSSNQEADMYGIPLPSPELLVEDEVRNWTSLTGQKLLFRFDRALAPGHLRLKRADGSSHEFAIVNFAKEDIDYVKQVIQNDLARPVFPEGDGFQSLSPEDVSKGYRVWTDRRNVPLIGKFVNVKNRNVVIEVAGVEQEYPKAGLSDSDRNWVDAEIKRRAEAARQAAESARAAAQSRFSSSGNSGGGGHGDSGSRFGGGSPFGFEYRFTCEHCGKTWTGPTPVSYCSNCRDKRFFECYRCGHKWSRTGGGLFDTCPKCSGNSNQGGSAGSSHSSHGSQTSQNSRASSSWGGSNSSSSASSYSSPTTSPSSSFDTTGGSGPGGGGVGMTILYIVSGLGVLAGIAAGLFRAFG